MAFLKAADFVLGNAVVCLRRPAPGATGSALGDGGAGGSGGPAARVVGSSSVADGAAVAAVPVALGVALLVALTCRDFVPAPAFPPQAAQTASSAAAVAATAARRIRTPVSRHFTRDEFYSGVLGQPRRTAVDG